MENTIKLNNVLKILRVMHEDSLKDLSEKVGLSVSRLSAIESGTRNLTLKTMEKYAKAYNYKTYNVFDLQRFLNAFMIKKIIEME